MCLVAWQPRKICARTASTAHCQNQKKVCHFDGISMSMIFAPDIPHSRPPGRDVGTGQTVSRVPLSRVMVPEQFAKFVHMLFAVCLLVFVCLQPQDSIPGLPGERVAQGRTLTRGPPSRVMNKTHGPSLRTGSLLLVCGYVCACSHRTAFQATHNTLPKPRKSLLFLQDSAMCMNMLHSKHLGDVHVPGGLATKPTLCQNSNHSTLPKSKKSLSF